MDAAVAHVLIVPAAVALCCAATRAVDAKVGFIGLGNMGAHMARNLVAAGHQVAVFDRASGCILLERHACCSPAVCAVVPEAVASVTEKGAAASDTAAGVAEDVRTACYIALLAPPVASALH